MNPSSFWATLKRFDAYAKPMDDFRIRTRSGGILTVLSGLVMILLFASEFKDYLQPQMKEELFVDTSRTGKLKINVDVIFSRISCDFLGIDAMDVSGKLVNSHDITINSLVFNFLIFEYVCLCTLSHRYVVIISQGHS